MEGNEDANREVFRDCMFAVIVMKSRFDGSISQPQQSRKKRKKETNIMKTSKGLSNGQHTKNADDPADLADFAAYLSEESFSSLPFEARNLSWRLVQHDHSLFETYSLPLSLSVIDELAALLPPSVSETLVAYGLIVPPTSDIQSFISPVLASYIGTVTAPAAPNKWIETRTSACQICERDWVPLTYHHLIPRGVHAKVLKRGWHEEHLLNSVAWLCRACHSFVHRMASNEELAREWYTVEKICERDDMAKWAQWIGRVRWKKT